MAKHWKAYCYACLGGGKDLTGPTTKKKANLEAASHASLYHHDVAVIAIEVKKKEAV